MMKVHKFKVLIVLKVNVLLTIVVTYSYEVYIYDVKMASEDGVFI